MAEEIKKWSDGENEFEAEPAVVPASAAPIQRPKMAARMDAPMAEIDPGQVIRQLLGGFGGGDSNAKAISTLEQALAYMKSEVDFWRSRALKLEAQLEKNA